MKRLLLVFCLLFVSVGPVLAVRPDEMLKDPALEARARAISAQLRCMVCQNQSIDDSNSDLAHDLRVLVRQRLEKGATDKQVIDYLVARYGAFVLLKPPFELQTALLWGAPLVMIVVAGGLAALVFRKNAAARRVAPLTPGEQQELAQLLGPHESA